MNNIEKRKKIFEKLKTFMSYLYSLCPRQLKKFLEKNVH